MWIYGEFHVKLRNFTQNVDLWGISCKIEEFHQKCGFMGNYDPQIQASCAEVKLWSMKADNQLEYFEEDMGVSDASDQD